MIYFIYVYSLFLETDGFHTYALANLKSTDPYHVTDVKMTATVTTNVDIFFKLTGENTNIQIPAGETTAEIISGNMEVVSGTENKGILIYSDQPLYILAFKIDATFGGSDTEVYEVLPDRTHFVIYC